jgi:hypothetical protein
MRPGSETGFSQARFPKARLRYHTVQKLSSAAVMQMTRVKAHRRRWIRPVLLVRCCSVVPVLLTGAMAQADGKDEIARCARIPSAGDRIICLEEALLRADAPPASTSAETPGTPGDATSASGAATEASTETRPHAREAAEFGLDELEQAPPSPESIRVTVVAVEKNAYGKLRYVTEGGQVWQQNDQRAPRYPDVPFAAEIRTAAAGSFFLQPLAGGVAVRVQRKR